MTITANDIPAQVERLKALPYTRELLPNEDGTWFVRIVAFEGCMTEGDTQEEALGMLDDAMTDWLTAKLEDGDPVPAPMAPENFPGQVFREYDPLASSRSRPPRRAGGRVSHQYVVSKLAAIRD